MYKISPFTPLFFHPSEDKFGVGSRYIQKFSPTDQILIEVIAVSEFEAIKGFLKNTATGLRTEIDWLIWSMNSTTILYYYILTGLENGYYQFELNGVPSELFEVTDDETKLSKTTLVQYSMKDNKQRKDAIFWISEKQCFFDFRAPGGFKDTNWTFSVTNEQFTTMNEDILDLYSSESTQKGFTLGNAEGCPIWYAEMLNRILSCTYVYFDKERYVRKDSSAPEMSVITEGVNSFIFSIALQQVHNIDSIESGNQLILRRVNNEKFRKVNSKLLII